MTCKVADFGLSREVETTDSSQGEYFTQVSTSWTIIATQGHSSVPHTRHTSVKLSP